ncbi:unnamed protein product [Somion occarium]|uniref:F-box domain-containing protein n=1 Tax=Somion occarium TaxID=3059160 RepID=A0ABP1EEG8_9APHY
MAAAPHGSNQLDTLEQHAYATRQDENNQVTVVEELRGRNSQTSLLQLPDKILLSIVEYNTHIFRWLAWRSITNIRLHMVKYKILAMSQVCHKLRSLLTSSPDPWTVIISLPYTTTSFVLELLHRATPRPVDFIAVTDAPYRSLLPQLQAALPVMRSVAIELSPGFDDVRPDDFQPISGVAPHLRSLMLTHPVVSETRRMLIPSIFDDVDCPEIVSLEVVNMTFSPAQFAWSGQLTRLVLLVDPEPVSEFLSPLILELHFLLVNVLSHVPLLEDLELGGVLRPEKNNYQLLSGIEVDLCQLQQLRVTNHGRSPSLLLKHINIPVSARIHLDFKSCMHQSSVRELVEIVSQKLCAGVTSLSGFAVRPVTGGGQGAFIEGYTEVDSMTEILSEDRYLFRVFVPSPFQQQLWPSTFLATLARLPLGNVKIFHMDMWSSGCSISNVETLLRAMPLIHTLSWSERTLKHLASFLMADSKEVEEAEEVNLSNKHLLLSSLKSLIIRGVELGGDSEAIQAFQSLCLALKERQMLQIPIHSLLLYDCTEVSEEDLRLLASYVIECFYDDTLISV